MLSTPRHHLLDYLKTLKMGHTSSTEMLVSDQKITPGKNPKPVTRLEYSYSSTPSLGLYSLIQGKIYLYQNRYPTFIITHKNCMNFN